MPNTAATRFIIAMATSVSPIFAFSVHKPTIKIVKSPHNRNLQKKDLVTLSASNVIDAPDETPLSAVEANSNMFSPGSEENERFKCDSSVAFWREFQREKFADASSNVREIVDIVTKNAAGAGASYWASHALRTGYFSGNAILGVLGSQLHDSLVKRDEGKADDSKKSLSAVSISGGLNVDIATRLQLEAFLCYVDDWKAVQTGEITFPWDAAVTNSESSGFAFQNHRQTNPVFAASQTIKVISESIGIFSRRNSGKEPSVWLSDKSAEALNYPKYYLNDSIIKQMVGYLPKVQMYMKCRLKRCFWEGRMQCNAGLFCLYLAKMICLRTYLRLLVVLVDFPHL